MMKKLHLKSMVVGLVFCVMSVVILNNYSQSPIHNAYATTAAIPYPIMDLPSIFSKINVLAKADSTKKVVATGIPIRVSCRSIAGAMA